MLHQGLIRFHHQLTRLCTTVRRLELPPISHIRGSSRVCHPPRVVHQFAITFISPLHHVPRKPSVHNQCTISLPWVHHQFTAHHQFTSCASVHCQPTFHHQFIISSPSVDHGTGLKVTTIVLRHRRTRWYLMSHANHQSTVHPRCCNLIGYFW